MISQNDILNSGIIDFEIYPVLEPDEVLKAGKGQNQKGLLVVSKPIQEEALIQFLSKILAAVEHDLAQDALHLHLTSDKRFSFQALSEVANFEKILIFGFPPAQIGLNIQTPLYHPTHFYHKTFLFADDLIAIQSTPNLKKSLWMSLKELFLKEA